MYIVKSIHAVHNLTYSELQFLTNMLNKWIFWTRIPICKIYSAWKPFTASVIVTYWSWDTSERSDFFLRAKHYQCIFSYKNCVLFVSVWNVCDLKNCQNLFKQHGGKITVLKKLNITPKKKIAVKKFTSIDNTCHSIFLFQRYYSLGILFQIVFRIC